MRYVVDRIEGDYAILCDEKENIKEVLLSEFGFNVYDGMILKYENGIYIIDDNSDLIKKIEELKKKVWKN